MQDARQHNTFRLLNVCRELLLQMLCNQMSALTKLEGEILFLKSLLRSSLLEFAGDAVIVMGEVDPVLNTSFCVWAHPSAHTSNRNF